MDDMFRALALAAVLVCGLAAPAPAVQEEERNQRLISRDVCIDRAPLVKGWHLADAAAAWTATGLVNVRISSSCATAPARVHVTQFWDPDYVRAGETSWPVETYGPGGRRSETDPTQWLYPEAAIRFNTPHLQWVTRHYTRAQARCWSTFVATHEIGHALGLPHAIGRRQLMSEAFKYKRYCAQLDERDVAALASLGYPAV